MAEDIEQSPRPHTITPTLTVHDAEQAIEFYKTAFGAKELMRTPGPGGQGIMHAELQIGDSILFVNDEFPEMGGRSPRTLGAATGSIYLTVPDVDAVFEQALEAGAQEEMAVADMFWGDRMGSLTDPFGHHWAIATHKEDVPDDEIARCTNEFYAQMAAEKERNIDTSV